MQVGGVAQMVERLLSMREAMGSMPIISTFLFLLNIYNILVGIKYKGGNIIVGHFYFYFFKNL